MNKIKMYRFTLKHIEYLPDNNKIETYDQTNWSSVTLVPPKDKEIVKIETKYIEVSDKCLRRKAK